MERLPVTIAYELKKGTKKYNKVRDAVLSRFRMSQRQMSETHSRLRKAEERHQLYVPLNEKETAAKTRNEQQGEQNYTTLVVPYSYAMVMSAHTYLSTVFLSRSPIFQYSGRHGESESQTQALESLIGYQTMVGGHLVPLYIWLLDPLKYSYGVIGTYWDDEVIHKPRYEMQQKTIAGIPVGPKKRVKVTEKVKGYSGSRLFNVRPWDFFPDTRVPLNQFQTGEFCGRVTEVNWNHMVRRQSQGLYFNLDELGNGRQSPTGDGREKGFEPGEGIKLPDTQDSMLEHGEKISNRGYYTLLEVIVDLIPQDWELGEQTYPEKWVFTVVNPEGEGVIVGAQPLDESHGKFPFFIQEHEIEGYNLTNRSMYDILGPLQKTMSWLVNTHFYNIRKVLNDSLVFDPSRITAKDLLTPGPGKLIRAKPAGYGSDLRTSVHQLQVRDVTQQHLNDTRLISEYMQRAVGVTDNIMGLLAMGGRRTATEVRQANSLGINRLKTQAEWFSASGWQPLSQVLVQMTQQHFEEERSFRILGDLMPEGQPRFMKVSPKDIAGFYDFIPVDGNMPIDRFAQVSLWTQLLGQMRQFPQLAQAYDLAGIFGWISQLAGLRNANKFRIQVRPDQQVASQAAAGNVVPLRSPDLSSALGKGASRGLDTGPAL